MKHLLIICFLSFVSFFCTGQEKNPNQPITYPGNSIFIELAGNAVFYGSLNYERIIVKKDFFYLCGRTGAGYGEFLDLSVLTVPIIFNGIFQIYHSVALEVGIGISFMRIGHQRTEHHWFYENNIVPTGNAGIRVQAKNGFLLRVDFTPFYTDLKYTKTVNAIIPSFGLSLGYSFGKKKK